MPLPSDLGAVACLEFAAALGRFADIAHRRAREMMALAESLGWFAGAWYVGVLRAFHSETPVDGPPRAWVEDGRLRFRIPRQSVTTSDVARDVASRLGFHVDEQRIYPDGLWPDAHRVDEQTRKQLEEIDAIIEGFGT